jgi:hypothetical protein
MDPTLLTRQMSADGASRSEAEDGDPVLGPDRIAPQPSCHLMLQLPDVPPLPLKHTFRVVLPRPTFVMTAPFTPMTIAR